jgi:hypothetical protein
MGMDMLDINFRLERSLGIPLDFNEFVERVQLDEPPWHRSPTVGDLFDWLVDNLEKRLPRGELVNDVTARRVDQVLADFAGPQLALAKRDASLEELISPTIRHAAWRALAGGLGVDLPPLRRSSLARALISAGWYGTGLCLTWGVFRFGATPYVLLTALSLAMFSCRLMAATSVSRVFVDPSVATRAALIDWVLSRHYPAILAQSGHWHEDNVWSVLRSVLVEVLLVSPDKVTPDARLVEDLGCS